MGIFDKAKDSLHSEKAEQVSDQALDRAEEFASSKAGDEHQEKISNTRENVDKRIGNE
ncbi:MAG: Rv0909 family putative TA system antitoxin [Flaviflexus sp.]|uniref:Antitoxin n=1 Tax=Flaviflexus ciconiae TaxID=2496867 RepID=A0A3S9PYB4_9ACTO|nr:Rv0909 family putative TA system antitoxin [Flaviflexus ciconiae]AZQ77351.1 antitoxin [Flaviflexus ciconiae]